MEKDIIEMKNAENAEEIIQRIKYLISEKDITQNEFAGLVEINSSNLSKHLNGKLPINESLLNRLVVNLGVSKDWLKSGVGDPYLSTTLAPISKGTPVYDIDVTAGPLTRTRMFTSENMVGLIDIPSIPEDCRVVRVSGDSMCPIINNGDYIAIRELTNPQMIFWGQIYVILLDDYRMVKYVRKHDDPDLLILRSENNNYDDIEVPRRDVRDMMMVHSVIHIDSRM
ncbi:MAG: XRE family transcriptional regulator [Muribaculaceae bacterium]|nr:XRE family transcriptional regulator [Muribaculaceae bacterium]